MDENTNKILTLIEVEDHLQHQHHHQHHHHHQQAASGSSEDARRSKMKNEKLKIKNMKDFMMNKFKSEAGGSDGGTKKNNKHSAAAVEASAEKEDNETAEDCVEGELLEDDCVSFVLNTRERPKQTSLATDGKMAAVWTRPRIKIFPSIREPEVTGETREQRALRRLKSRLSPYVKHPCYHTLPCLSDVELLAWLTTFDLNVYMVEARLKRKCQVRRKLGLDTILQDYKAKEVLDHHYTAGMCGVDRQGRPIWYELLGKLDMNYLVKCVSREELVRHKFYQLEMIKKAAVSSGFCQVLVIVDMKKMPLKVMGPALDIWKEYIGIVQDHYPYLVKEYIILHPYGVFTQFTLALRPYLNRLMRSKVTVLGRHYLIHLEQRIEKHEIPAYLGGYKCDIDNSPWCEQNLSWDGKVPKWMFTYPRIAANMHTLTIPGGQRLVKETHVATEESHVWWQFFNMNHPIVLSVYYNRIADDACVIKEQRIYADSSSKGDLAGIFSKTAGRYLAVMDNCKNHCTPARGHYNIVVRPPEWLAVHLTETKPLGESFDMSQGIGEEERKWRRKKFFKEPHHVWSHELPPIGKI